MGIEVKNVKLQVNESVENIAARGVQQENEEMFVQPLQDNTDEFNSEKNVSTARLKPATSYEIKTAENAVLESLQNSNFSASARDVIISATNSSKMSSSVAEKMKSYADIVDKESHSSLEDIQAIKKKYKKDKSVDYKVFETVIAVYEERVIDKAKADVDMIVRLDSGRSYDDRMAAIMGYP